MRFVAQVFPPTIFSSGDLLHQRFSSIDEICCASVSCGIELCSATSPSPSSFVEHLAKLVDLMYALLCGTRVLTLVTRFEIEAPTHQGGFQLCKVVDSIMHK
ncbi:hypothetical protein HN873_051881, partial [Arachis hypogaea]